MRNLALVAAGLCVALVGRAEGQLKGHYVAGFAGAGSGSQATPGISLFLPVYYYATDDIKNDEGESFAAHPQVSALFLGPGLLWVTNVRILGGRLGGSIAPLNFIKSRIEGRSLDVPGSLAFTDMFVQPLQLGWETSRADFVAGYSFFAPTGKWEQGGDDNAGLGMWSHLLQAGTTLHLDSKHQWSLSSLGSYEIHSHKQDADIKVGDILTVEGGLGRSFFKFDMIDGKPVPALITTVGLAYYGQFKMTSDEASVATPLLEGHKDRVYGLGLEASLILPKSGFVFGLRAEPEFEARNRTQGWTFLLSIAYELKSLVKP